MLLRSLNNEPFAMEPGALESFLARAGRIESGAAVRLADSSLSGSSGYSVCDGTAVIPVSGVLLKSSADAEMFRAYGEDATSYGEIAEALDAAEHDASVDRIMFAVDSPGGQVAGIHAISDRVAATLKPTSAHVDTLCASAAYWIASQADEITASRGAMVGSIGAYVPVVDMSAMAEAAGIKVHVISSGANKGGGVPGAPVKAEYLAEVQARINQIHAEFVADVAKGRGADATAIAASADGSVYNISDSLTRGLIDRQTSDPEKDRKMAEATDRKSYAALIKEFPGHAALVAEAMESGSDVGAVRGKIEKAEADKVVAQRDADLAKAKTDLEAAAKVAAEKDAKLADLEAKMAALTASHAALKGLADGAKTANEVKAEAHEGHAVTATQAAYDAMSPMQKAAFHQAGGKING